ncbi:M23 family metallopeptidase [candidate division WOR-3 bacterium]|nr:M23 family metallopeptidase [candidate division WOR-3 bacterium]
MSKKISILFVPEDGEIKKISTTSNLLLFFVILLFIAAGFIAFLGYRYHDIYTLARKSSVLEEQVQYLEKEREEKIEKITEELNRVAYKNQRLLAILGIEDRQYLAIDVPDDYLPSIWPTRGWLSQGFSSYHQAVDIAAPIGTPIVSTINGIVTAVWEDPLLGNVLEIANEKGYRIVYGHNSSIDVKEGDKVNRGDIVASVGTSGITTGPHLHYEIYYRDSILNPKEYLKQE